MLPVLNGILAGVGGYDCEEGDEAMSSDVDSGAREKDAVSLLLASREQFLRFLERRLGARDAAEEVLQAAYLKMLETSDSIAREESAVAWFYRVLQNAMIDRARRKAIEGRALDRHAQELAALDDSEGEPLLDAACRCVTGLVDTLKPEYGEMVRRVDVEGATVQAAAEAIGITPNNASVRLHRARAALRGQLVLTCGACAEHRCIDCTCRP